MRVDMIAYRARMITKWRKRVTDLVERLRRWSERGRFAGWSSRRRWVVLVLVPTVLVCCGGTVVGVPVTWALRETVEASRGAVSPDAAVDAYLSALGYGRDEGLLSLLVDEHQDELLAQWRAYRAAMEDTDPPPARLDYEGLAVTAGEDGRAAVSVDVTAVWWRSGGGAFSTNSTAHPWRFETREEDGWRVAAVEAPAWCGVYVLADRCG